MLFTEHNFTATRKHRNHYYNIAKKEMVVVNHFHNNSLMFESGLSILSLKILGEGFEFVQYLDQMWHFLSSSHHLLLQNQFLTYIQFHCHQIYIITA